MIRHGKDMGDYDRDTLRASKADLASLFGKCVEAKDFRSDDVVIVSHNHGSVFTFVAAFYLPDPFDDRFVWVLTEHDGYHCLVSEEVLVRGRYLAKGEPFFERIKAFVTENHGAGYGKLP